MSNKITIARQVQTFKVSRITLRTVESLSESNKREQPLSSLRYLILALLSFLGAAVYFICYQ